MLAKVKIHKNKVEEIWDGNTGDLIWSKRVRPMYDIHVHGNLFVNIPIEIFQTGIECELNEKHSHEIYNGYFEFIVKVRATVNVELCSCAGEITISHVRPATAPSGEKQYEYFVDPYEKMIDENNREDEEHLPFAEYVNDLNPFDP